MKRTARTAGAALLAACAALATTPFAAAQTPGQPQAQAAMKDADGKSLGTVTLTQFPQGLLIHAELDGLKPGWHAVHIHENGACAPNFAAAGGHFNPGGGKHGMDTAPMHAGDLPNFLVDAGGKGGFQFLSHAVTLGDGPASLFKPGGTAFVVHAQADDYTSQPAGASGDRVACGVIAKP
ncbi:superoxide dismutase family protein [Azospirillum isscasi]|uniref:Superoxide dismutase family protein n=1 Tax=Azospirillum isscasi TaxID=3053926 RepID=A0ABU0WKV1_9PROT|nr:superoxide dismutase family protein [Azospirillum isscasi]MDQ2104866.1 superoxide dismutase family protein [Azospirillum isscasi]